MSIPAHLWRAARLTIALWLLTVVVISLPMLGLAGILTSDSANGSLLKRNGVVVGSHLIGQQFSSRRYLNGRPSGKVILSAGNPLLAERVAQTAQAWHDSGIDQPAADLLLKSGSGVDPHISLEAARQQLPSLARERGVSMAQLEGLVSQNQEDLRSLRSIQPVVNVLDFNLALDKLDAASKKSRKS
jgi:K+-transporting ATPase ATPase C chain